MYTHTPWYACTRILAQNAKKEAFCFDLKCWYLNLQYWWDILSYSFFPFLLCLLLSFSVFFDSATLVIIITICMHRQIKKKSTFLLLVDSLKVMVHLIHTLNCSLDIFVEQVNMASVAQSADTLWKDLQNINYVDDDDVRDDVDNNCIKHVCRLENSGLKHNLSCHPNICHITYCVIHV